MTLQPKIVARNVVKTYPSADGKVLAIDDFNLEVADGEFVCIVGPSGCGKSTFLRILAGLIPLTSGTVEIRRDIQAKKPLNSMVFQEYAIYPWKTVRDNVAFGLEMRGLPKKTRYTIVDDWLNRVGLQQFANYYPHQLSGGMKQRVSIARALANDPEVLLMDEPLGALDAQMRLVLQEELLKLWEIDRKTVVYITHSIDEAILLGDRVIVMTAHPGRKKVEFTIEIPRPRVIETMATPEFAAYKGIIWEALKNEVAQVYGEPL
ncbi:MAG TPA: ABC transporter ATP-binding protein [Phototrophicaceae bacterium]|nr:ABC transporter ATP-binding protein [Phototrophicaceae bacterium]